MAGYVKLLRSIWTDPEFVALNATAQRLYLLLISQPDISHVGVVPLMPARWARLATDTSTVDATLDLTLLEESRFVATDEDTGEVWVRSYIVHDEAWKLTNGKKSLVNAHERVYSPRLRNLIATVLSTVDVTVELTLDSTVDVSHKPETMNHEPPPPPATVKGGGGAHPKQVALEAASLLMEHETNVGRPGAWKASVAERLLRDYDVAGMVAEFGSEAGRHLYELERPMVAAPPSNPYAPRPLEHDPDCGRCAGSGWKTIDPITNTVAPCDCEPPSMGSVHELRPA